MNASDGSEGLLRQILASQRFAVLATLSNQQPYSSLVTFAVSDDLRHLIFATSRHTQKYRNILENNRVALLTNNSNNSQSDFTEATAVTVLGTASELTNDGSQALMESYLNKHRSLRDFVERKDTTIVDVLVTDYIIARFNGAERIHVNDIL